LKKLLKEEAGVEPLVMKILAGIILFTIALGIGIPLYLKLGPFAEKTLQEAIGPRFDLSANPSSITIKRNNSETATLNVVRVEGYSNVVALSSSGEPDNVYVSFSPTSGTPTFGSTATITVGASAPLGKHTITVKGKGTDGKESVALIEITIEA